MFLKIFTGKQLCQSLLQACNFIKKRLQYWCFPAKFAKCLGKSIFKNNCERPLLFVSSQNTIANSCGEFGLDDTLTECRLNKIILFDQMQSYYLYDLKNVSLTFLLRMVASMSLRNRLARKEIPPSVKSALTWTSFFYIKFANFQYITYSVPNLVPVCSCVYGRT